MQVIEEEKKSSRKPSLVRQVSGRLQNQRDKIIQCKNTSLFEKKA